MNGGGRSRDFCFVCAVSGGEFAVSGWRVWLNVLRNDLKSYGTAGTGSFCSGEKREKSTAIQVDLSHLSVVFQCTHRPPRARSTIAIKYSTGRGDQGQFEHLEVGEVQWFDVGRVDSIVTVGRADRWHPVVVGVGGWQGRLGVCSVSFLFATLTPKCIRGYPFDLSGMALATNNWDPCWIILPAASALPLRVGGRSLSTVGRADRWHPFFSGGGDF
ncbi:hypothetical protein MalM14_06920 [Gimesia chilikensis]|nr:hypothetical protein MalM14_06920 [Gimesia chilikensis]